MEEGGDKIMLEVVSGYADMFMSEVITTSSED
jgi:hypothetical protein